MNMIVTCPHCSQQVVWDTNNVHRPFCSERCKKIDLGAWAEEKYVINGAVEPEVDDE